MIDLPPHVGARRLCSEAHAHASIHRAIHATGMQTQATRRQTQTHIHTPMDHFIATAFVAHTHTPNKHRDVILPLQNKCTFLSTLADIHISSPSVNIRLKQGLFSPCIFDKHTDISSGSCRLRCVCVCVCVWRTHTGSPPHSCNEESPF